MKIRLVENHREKERVKVGNVTRLRYKPVWRRQW